MRTGIELPAADVLLGLAADEACRRIALALLDATVAARARLDDPDDAVALHGFRVALRRLRTWLRAYDEFLHESVRKKARRRLRDLSRAAGECRDGEVHLAWLRDAEESLRSRERPGVEWLLRRVSDRQREAEATFRARIAHDFTATVETLGDDLAVFTRRVDLRDATRPPTLAEAAAPRLLREATALGERLAAVQSIQDQAVAHAARLAGKRLRYVLEPIADGVAGAPALVKRLRNLQDTIGEMHDVHVMAEDVIEAAERAAAEQTRRVATALLEGEGDDAARRELARDPRPGLLAIAAQLRARGESAFAELQHRWLGAHAEDLTEEARNVVARLVDVAPAPRTTAAADESAVASSDEVSNAAAAPPRDVQVEVPAIVDGVARVPASAANAGDAAVAESAIDVAVAREDGPVPSPS
jgi:CHAD domain-containing protein